MKYDLTHNNSVGHKRMILIKVCAIWLICGSVLGQENVIKKGLQIKAPRPLREAAMMLEECFGKPVTYEDPVWKWRGDKGPSSLGVPGLYPIESSFNMPESIRSGQQLNADLLSRIVAAYHQQTEGPRFRIISSRMGVHIIPWRSRNASGLWDNAESVMDVRVIVPTARRTAAEHFRALCDAMTASSGVTIEAADQWLNYYYAANGIAPRMGETPDAAFFNWGTTGISGREALISLLDGSATTLTWGLICRAGEESCVLNLHSIVTNVVGADGVPVRSEIKFDRRKTSTEYPFVRK